MTRPTISLVCGLKPTHTHHHKLVGGKILSQRSHCLELSQSLKRFRHHSSRVRIILFLFDNNSENTQILEVSLIYNCTHLYCEFSSQKANFRIMSAMERKEFCNHASLNFATLPSVHALCPGFYIASHTPSPR